MHPITQRSLTDLILFLQVARAALKREFLAEPMPGLRQQLQDEAAQIDADIATLKDILK